LALAVQGGAICTPLVHAHADTDHDDHRSTLVHAHWSSHARAPVAHDGSSVESTDRDPIYLQVFVAVETATFQVPLLPRATFTLTPLGTRVPRRIAIVTHGHDPPLVAALDSRPPPSLPVLI
jgi:hypothetical protein